jgi:hypothetical protein
MTFELYKSTYMSAADKLDGGHKKRAEEMRKHAAESGISAFRGNDEFQSIYGHPFIFETYPDLRYRDDFLGKFFITGFEDQVYGSHRDGYHGLKVIMKSDYGKTIKLEFVVFEDHVRVGEDAGFYKMELQYAFHQRHIMEIPNFKFNNRKDAFQLRKFILELAEDGELEDGDEYFTLNTMPINKLYSTN